MSRTSRFLFIILAEACASTVLASAQTASSQTEASIPTTSYPVAYIYVDSIVASNKTQIDAYAAASN
jgi:hypothetical protein